VKNRAEVCFTARGGLFEYVYDVADVSGLSARWENLAGFCVKGDEPNAISLLEHHV
jgi:hypothetical protein